MWSGVNQKYLILLDYAASWSFSSALPERLRCQRLCFCISSDDPKLKARLLCSSHLKGAVRFGKVVTWQENIGSLVLVLLVVNRK